MIEKKSQKLFADAIKALRKTDISNFEDYEIIDNAETGAAKLTELPTKTARIKRIKAQYCNCYSRRI